MVAESVRETGLRDIYFKSDGVGGGMTQGFHEPKVNTLSIPCS